MGIGFEGACPSCCICTVGPGGCAPFCCCVWAGAFVRSNTDPPVPACFVAAIDKLSEVIMNSAAAAVVNFDNKVAEPLGPNAVCEPMPPNAPARSAALPLCSNTTMIRNKQTMT